MWQIYGFLNESGKTIWKVSEEHATKRKAVNAMMSARKPKTAIVRDGHTYVFQVAD